MTNSIKLNETIFKHEYLPPLCSLRRRDDARKHHFSRHLPLWEGRDGVCKTWISQLNNYNKIFCDKKTPAQLYRRFYLFTKS